MRRGKIVKSILAVAVVLVVLMFLLVPVFVSSEKGRKIILAKINDSLAGQTDFAAVSMSWRKGLNITDINFRDDSNQTLVTVKQITTKPHYCSILMGRLSFGKTVVKQPRIEINFKAPQAKEVQSPQQKKTTDKKSQPIVLPIKKIDLALQDGHVKVAGPKNKTVELSQINAMLNLRPPGMQTDFDMNMTVTYGNKESNIHTAGQITTQRHTGLSLKGASGNLAVKADDLNLTCLEPVFALAGFDIKSKGNIYVDIKSKIGDGRVKKLDGMLKGRKIDITIGQLDGDKFKSSTLDATVELSCQEQMLNIANLQIKADWFGAQASGDVPTTFDSLAEFIKVDSKDPLKARFSCDVARLASQMPQTLGLKEDALITSGILTGNIEKLTTENRRKIGGQIKLDRLQGIVRGKPVAFSQPIIAEVQIASDDTSIKFDRLNVTAPFATISGTGSSELLKYTAEADLAELQAKLGKFVDIGRYSIAGEFFSEGTISGSKSKIVIAGSSTCKNLRLSSEITVASEPEADVSFAFDINRDDNIIDIDFIKAAVSFGQVNIENTTLPLNERAEKPVKLTILANNIDLKRLQPFAVLFASFPKELQLAGTVKSKITINSKEDSYRIVTDATDIENLRLSYPGQMPFTQERITLVFDGDYDRTGLADKLLTKLNMKSKLSLSHAEYMGLNFGPTELNPHLQKGILMIPAFSTAVNNGRLNFAAQANFKEKPTLLKMPQAIQIIENIQITDEMSRKLLAYVNPIFSNALNVSGIASFACEQLVIPLADSAKDDIVVIGTISITQLRLQGSDLLGQLLLLIGTNAQSQNVTIHPTRFVLQNGSLRYEDMQMDIDDYPFNFKGAIGLDRSLDMTVILPYTLEGKTVKTGSKDIGERISLPLKGTIDKPELDASRILEQQLTERLKEKATEVLGEELGKELGEELGKKAEEILEGLFK